MTYEPARKRIAFVLPQAFSKARLTLCSATDADEEIRVNVSPDATPWHTVSTGQLPKGTWRVFLEWLERSKWYQDEMEIVIR